MGASTVWLGKPSSTFTLRHSPLFTQRLSLLYLPSRCIYIYIYIYSIYTEGKFPLFIQGQNLHYSPCDSSLFSHRQRPLFFTLRHGLLCFPNDILSSVYPVTKSSRFHLHSLLYLSTDTVPSIYPPKPSSVFGQ